MKTSNAIRFGQQLSRVLFEGSSKPTYTDDMGERLAPMIDTNSDGKVSAEEEKRAKDVLATAQESLDTIDRSADHVTAMNAVVAARSAMRFVDVGDYTPPAIAKGALPFAPQNDVATSPMGAMYGFAPPAEIGPDLADIVRNLDVSALRGVAATLSARDARRLVTALAPALAEKPNEAATFYAALAEQIDNGSLKLNFDDLAPGMPSHVRHAGDSQALFIALQQQINALAVLTSSQYAQNARNALQEAMDIHLDDAPLAFSRS